MIIFSPDSQTLKNIVLHCSQTLEEIMQFLSPNQLWNSLDGCSVADVVLQMLLFPHKRNPSSIPSSFLFREETTEGDMARRKLVAQAPSFRACSHTRLHVLIFSLPDANSRPASRPLAYLDNCSLAKQKLATYWQLQAVTSQKHWAQLLPQQDTNNRLVALRPPAVC